MNLKSSSNSPLQHLIIPHCEEDMPTLRSNYDFERLLEKQKIYPTLHLLPLLYAKAHDQVVLALRDKKNIFQRLNENFYRQWGFNLNSPELLTPLHLPSSSTHTLKPWCFHPQLYNTLKIPSFPCSWSLICYANCKSSFLHLLSPHLKSQAFQSLKEFKMILDTTEGPWVIKAPYQAAGNKLLFINKEGPSNKQTKKIEKYLYRYSHCILQRHLEILQEFSSQWLIDNREIKALGNCLGKVVAGRYTGCIVGIGIDKQIGFENLEKHKKNIYCLLKNLQSRGYEGPVGIDAFTVNINGPTLIPFTDVNARETFGSLALKIQKNYFSDQNLSIELCHGEGLFPSFVTSLSGKKWELRTNLRIAIN